MGDWHVRPVKLEKRAPGLDESGKQGRLIPACLCEYSGIAKGIAPVALHRRRRMGEARTIRCQILLRRGRILGRNQDICSEPMPGGNQPR